MSYRDEIFESYRTGQALPSYADPVKATRWGGAFDHYLHGWLPADAKAKIADLACGSGLLLKFFSDRGYQDIIGVDLSEEQVHVAMQLSDKVLVKDAMVFLSENEGSYDLLISLDLIEHFTKEELSRFLKLSYQALRPGGRLVLQTPNCGSPLGVVQRYSDFTHEIGLTPNSLCWLMRLAGFQSLETREQGPVLRGLYSAVRCVLWRLLRLSYMTRDLIETGSTHGVYTRVFIASGIKPG